MTLRIGINGFGRMGRLTMRLLLERCDVEIVRINDPAGDAQTLAHLLNFDSVHGRWTQEAYVQDDAIVVGTKRITCTRNQAISDTDWSGCDRVVEVLVLNVDVGSQKNDDEHVDEQHGVDDLEADEEHRSQNLVCAQHLRVVNNIEDPHHHGPK